jgi:SAM-dependent methyltransferase
MGYRPDSYWGGLLEDDDLSRTGYADMPLEFNRWLYRNGQRNLDAFMRTQGVRVPERVFDAGAGTGFWVDHWLARGAKRVDGCDLVPAAVMRLAARQVGDFAIADLADGPPTRSSYPLVSAMNVLLHITSDDAFSRALDGLASMVEPGGHLLLAEPAVHDARRATPFDPATHARVRHLDAYHAPGLELVAVAPTAVIGADPIEGSRVWGHVWRLATRVAGRGTRLGAVAGRAIYVLDPLLMRGPWAPTGKFLLFRRS